MPDVQERQMIDDTGSLSDHEAQWQAPKRGQSQELPAPLPRPEPEPDTPTAEQVATEAAREEATDPSLRFKPQLRAKKNQARAEDVPRIKELTGKLKDIERERDEWKTKWESAQRPIAVSDPPRTTIETNPSILQTEKFVYPTYDKALETNPALTYEQWQDDKLDARDTWREQRTQQVTAKQQQDQAVAAQRQSYQHAQQTYQQRRTAYEQAHPERATVFTPAAVQALDARIPNPAKPLIEATIMLAENGPDLLYTLQQRPDLLAELALFSDGKPVTEQYVAIATQWLQHRVQPGTTVAGAPVKQKQPAKPPTTVRTGPMQTGTEPPGDGASLAEHEAFFTKKRR